MVRFIFCLLLSLFVVAGPGVRELSWAQEAVLYIADKSFHPRPSRKTEGFMEYEAPDRSYALKSPTDLAHNWPLPSFQEFESVRVINPLILNQSGQNLYFYDRKGRESVAEYFLRHLILHIDSKDLTSVHFDRDIQKVALEKNQLQIWSAYRELFKKGIEANAFNLFVRYADPEMTTISEVSYEPTIQDPRRRIQSKESIPEMVEEFASQISKVLKSGYFPYKATFFEEVQKNSQYVSRKNVAGRDLRIAGVTESYEQFLTHHLRNELQKKGFELVEAYYFGSRVMTRDVLLKMDPKMVGFLDLSKGVLKKNQVREGGLTSVSDIELFLVVKPLENAKPMADEVRDAFQLELRDQVREALNARTRRYSLGMKILFVPQDFSRSEYFSSIQEDLMKTKSWRISPEQYVRFYPTNFQSPLCSRLFYP